MAGACPAHPRLAATKEKKDVDARRKAAHDGDVYIFGARFTASSRLAFAEPGRSGLG